MIKVRRTKIPQVLRDNAKQWLKDYENALNEYRKKATQDNKLKVVRAEVKYNHREVKSSLQTMFNSKCAYCESDIEHVSYSSIEHYQPKSKYPRLCFTWSNFLLGCSVCNGKSYKSDKFPTKKDNGPILNPTKEDPERFLEFDYDPKAKVAILIAKNPRGQKTIEVLGLNRPKLVRHRSKVVKLLVYLALKAEAGDKEALVLFNSWRKDGEEYCAFANMLKKRFKL